MWITVSSAHEAKTPRRSLLKVHELREATAQQSRRSPPAHTTVNCLLREHRYPAPADRTTLRSRTTSTIKPAATEQPDAAAQGRAIAIRETGAEYTPRGQTR